MKTVNVRYGKSNIILLAIVLFTVLSMVACARKISFNHSTVVPAAEGAVKIKRDNNNNYAVDVNVTRLAEPKRLAPPKDVYVVWSETEQAGVKNLGQLKSGTSLFSKALKGSLKTVLPYKPTKVFITAEDQANIEYPGMYVILTTDPF